MPGLCLRPFAFADRRTGSRIELLGGLLRGGIRWHVTRGVGGDRGPHLCNPQLNMVRSTIIVRATDALPLAASVDDEQVGVCSRLEGVQLTNQAT